MHFIAILKMVVLGILLTPVCHLLHAQQTNLQFKHLTPNDGLTQGVIRNIFTDSRGFVWMTGLDGINRFDGTRCLANNEIAPGLVEVSSTIGILEDKSGNIWFGYADGLIQYSYRKNAFTFFSIRKMLGNRWLSKSDGFSPLVTDDNNRIVVGHIDRVLFFFNPSANTITDIPAGLPIGYSICGLFLKKEKTVFNKNLYIGLQKQSTVHLYRYIEDDSRSSRWEFVTSNNGFDNNVFSMVLQDEDHLVIAATNQITRFNFNTRSFEHRQMPHLDFPGVSIDIHKNIWIGTTQQGVYALDGRNMNITAHYQNEPGNTSGIMGNCAGAYCDKLGNLWIASKYKGVDYCNLNDTKFLSSFTGEQSKAAGSSSFIRDIVKDAQGNFYCGTIDKGIVVLDKNLQFVKQLPGIPGDLVCPDLLVHEQWLYIASDIFSSPYLFKYNLLNGAIKRISAFGYSPEDPGNAVYQLSRMSDGDLLAACYNGLYRFNTRSDAFEQIPGVSFQEATVFGYEDRHGQIYKGISHGGLVVYQPAVTGYKPAFEIEKKLTVKHCAEISDSLLWIGTSNGLYLFNTRTLSISKHFTTTSGLANNVVYALMPDDKGNLWMSTNKGLSYYNGATSSFKHFTVADGLQGNEFNTHAVVKADDGRVIFGGVNGLTTINEAMLQKQPTPPIVQIAAIKADSSINPFLFDEKYTLRLPPGSNAVEFEILAIDYVNPAKCKLQYRLKGYDDEWRETANPGTARYIKLKHGNYVLEYRASDTEGRWIANSKTFVFSIAAYWWQTTAFKIVAMLIMAALVWLLIRWYVKSKLRHQRIVLEKNLAIQLERERIIADLHDDVGATLSSMHIYGELAGNIFKDKPQESHKLMGKISEQGKDLMGRMNDIIWSLKPAGEDKYSFTARLKNYSQELLAAKNIVTNFNINETLNGEITNPVVRKNVLLIAKEAMNNIAKYSGADTATISLQKTGSTIVLSVRDDGQGFDTAIARQGNGIHNMQQRSRVMQGSLNVTSSPGTGTLVECRFPA
ncbi:MAG: two-component regulator propeller domain-containing protein [Bacteroidota bacterium]